MPWFVPLIVLGVVGGGSALAPAVFLPLLFSTALGNALVFGSLGVLGLSGLGKLMPRPDLGGGFAQQSFDRATTIRQPIEAWQIIYGKSRTRGTLTFFERTGTNNEMVHMVITFAGHQVESFEEVLINDEVIPLDGSGDATGTYAGYVHVEKSLGDPTFDGQPYPGLASALPAKWTANHKQRGRAGLYVRIKDDPKKFPAGIGNIRATIKGKKVLDTRTSTTAWSVNSALVARDWAAWDIGLGIPAAEISGAEVNAAANACDEDVSLAAGGTEDRYTANGAFRLDQGSPQDAMTGILSSMAGDFLPIGGMWMMYAGVWRAPTITITERDFRGELTHTSLISAGESFTAVKGVYVSPDNNYQPSDYPPVTNATYDAEDGRRKFEELPLPFTDTATRAQRIAKIKLEDHRRMGRVTAPLKLTQFNLTAIDNVQLTFPQFSWTNKTFRVTSSRITSERRGRRAIFGIDLELKAADSGIYTWASSEEKPVTANASNSTADSPNWAARRAASPVIGINGGSTIVGSSPLSAIDNGSTARVTITPNVTIQYGSETLVYTGSTTNFDGRPFSTWHYVYADDPDLVAGTPAGGYQITQDFSTAVNGEGRVYFGAIKTPADGAGGTGGQGGGGGNDGGCPVIEQFLFDGVQVKDAAAGGEVESLVGGVRAELALILGMEIGEELVPCFRCVTENGVETEQSFDTPIDQPDGSSVRTERALRAYMATSIDGVIAWSRIVRLEYIGPQRVARMHVGGRSFAHGTDPRRRGFTHNINKL